MLEVRRRQLIALLGGAVASWPLAARAQQSQPMRRIGVLWSLAEDDPESKARLEAFRQGLELLGWSEGRNIRIDIRFAGGRAEPIQSLAKELVAMQPDVIVGQGMPNAAALQRESRTIPIVFFAVGDPLGGGLVASLARPGGNLTGLQLFEPSISGKWLTMLKEIAPRLERVAFLFNPKISVYWVQVVEDIARSLAIELVPTPVGNAADIERAIESFALIPNGGLLLPPDSTTIVHRDLIIALAAWHRLPAVYSDRTFVVAGGLMSYGIERIDHHRQAASYVDRILRGTNPADLPVQAPTKYETVLNLRTAKALGLTVPAGLLVAADEVIE